MRGELNPPPRSCLHAHGGRCRSGQPCPCCCGRFCNGAEDGNGAREEVAIAPRFHKETRRIGASQSLHNPPCPVCCPLPCPQLPRGSMPTGGCSGPPTPQSPPFPRASAEPFFAPLFPSTDAAAIQPFQAATKASPGTQRRRAEERPGFK